VRLLFIGPPGAGKGTQAGLVANRLGVPHISTGEMFRDHVARQSDLGRRVKEIMEAGAYVPDEITVAMLGERIGLPDAAGGFILDGFPRTRAQAEALDRLLGFQGLDAVILFEVDEDELAKRMLARGRSDDSEETIRRRFEVYREQTEPLIDLYRGRGILHPVDGLGTLGEVTERTLKAIESSSP
jgi:adenylate kinase